MEYCENCTHSVDYGESVLFIKCERNKKRKRHVEKQHTCKHFELRDEPKCRICGCTQNNACEGGCYWVEEDLCSKCAMKKVR